MDGFELNKIAGAILLAGVIAMLTGFVSRVLIPEPHMEESLIVASGAGEGEQAGAAEEETLQPIGPLLAAASVDEGMNVARKCTACHTFEQGGANKVGPNLWNVVAAEKAHRDDYSYSAAMAEAEGEWTYEDLNAFLHNPREALPGTKMSFAGLRKVEDRANIVAYLRSLSDSPAPLPEPAAEPAPEQPAQSGATEAAPADAAATEGAQPEQPTQQEQPQQSQPQQGQPQQAQPQQGGAAAEGAPGGQAPAAPATEQPPPEGQATEPPAAEQPPTTGGGSTERQTQPSAPPEQPKPEQQASTTAAAPPGAAANASGAASLVALIKTASPEDGAKVARKCTACHTFEKDAGNRVGPNLWGVIGGPVAHREDFRYSKAMEEHGGEWTYETLATYLEKPRDYIPGTKMTFAGLRKPEERAAILAYMRTMSDNPPPLD